MDMDSSREEGIVADVSVDDSGTEVNKDNLETSNGDQDTKADESTTDSEQCVKTEHSDNVGEKSGDRVEEVALKEDEKEDKQTEDAEQNGRKEEDVPSGEGDQPSEEGEDQPGGKETNDKSQEDVDQINTEDGDKLSGDNIEKTEGEDADEPKGEDEDKPNEGDKFSGKEADQPSQEDDEKRVEDLDMPTRESDQKDADKQDGEDTPEKGDEQKEEEERKMDILGNGLLTKEVIKPGNGRESRPISGQVVTLKCVGYLDETNEKFEEFESLQFELGEGDINHALDLGVALMELGEQCTLIADARYAYGELGRQPDIPGGARLRYELELIKVEDPPDYSAMDTMERVNRANKKRERGNDFYSRSDYSSAINSYSRALTILDDDEVVANKEEYKSVEELKMKCYNNLAACQLKVEAYDAALKSCNLVLNVEPNNVKALFRKGKVLANKGELDDAITEMRKAIKIEPVNKIIHQELSKLVSKHNEQMQSTKEMCKKMVGDMAEVANHKVEPKNKSKFPSSKFFLGAFVVALGAVVTSIILAMRSS